MAQAAASSSNMFDPNNGIFPTEGITEEQLFNLGLSTAVPACKFADNLWWNGNRHRLSQRIMLSKQSSTLVINGISFSLPIIDYGCLYPVTVHLDELCYDEIDRDARLTRAGLTPSFASSNSNVSTFRKEPHLVSGNKFLGNKMGLCPLWVQTPKGTNRHKIVEQLKILTYYVLVHDPCQIPQQFRFMSSKCVKWDPIVWRRDLTGNLVDPSPEWKPSDNMTVVPKPSPLATWDSNNQQWVRPEPRTEIPGCSIGCVPITTIPCGVIWKKGVGYVWVRSKTGVYLGTLSTMQVSSWGEYNRKYKGRSFRIEIDCSASVQFSENAFEEGYYWDEDNEQWFLCVFDDSDSDSDCDSNYSDPMDDCSDCGDSRCPCQYYNRK